MTCESVGRRKKEEEKEEEEEERGGLEDKWTGGEVERCKLIRGCCV